MIAGRSYKGTDRENKLHIKGERGEGERSYLEVLVDSAESSEHDFGLLSTKEHEEIHGWG